MELKPFKILLHERSGLLFEGPDEDKLARAIASRVQADQYAGTSEYYQKIKTDETAFQSLINELTVNETYFFREPEQIRLLVEKLVPRLMDRLNPPKPIQKPIQIFSAGCSSGEEPYSLAMALWQKYGSAASQWFKITGGDIDSHILEKARIGVYSAFSFRGVPDEIRECFFDETHRTWRIKSHIRGMVDFCRVNLLTPVSFNKASTCDVIFFRNVSIYFDAPTRRLIQNNLSTLLKDDGILIIGTAETLANDLSVLPLVAEDQLFYFVKGQALLPPAAVEGERLKVEGERIGGREQVAGDRSDEAVSNLVSNRKSAREQKTSRAPTSSLLARPEPQPQDLIRLATEKRFAELEAVIKQILSVDAEHCAGLLLKAYLNLNRRKFEGAAAAARQVLAQNNWSVDALLMLGQIAKWQNQPNQALKYFKQAVYACPQCWPAHFYLAEQHKHREDLATARRSWRTVLHLLDTDTDPRAGLQVIPLDLPPSETRFLCEHYLARS